MDFILVGDVTLSDRQVFPTTLFTFVFEKNMIQSTFEHRVLFKSNVNNLKEKCTETKFFHWQQILIKDRQPEKLDHGRTTTKTRLALRQSLTSHFGKNRKTSFIARYEGNTSRNACIFNNLTLQFGKRTFHHPEISGGINCSSIGFYVECFCAQHNFR